jgi:hypothetical protein
MGAFMRFPNELIFRRKPAGPLVKHALVLVSATRMASLKASRNVLQNRVVASTANNNLQCSKPAVHLTWDKRMFELTRARLATQQPPRPALRSETAPSTGHDRHSPQSA